MRRELSLAGASLVVYACALVLASLVICGTGHASETEGEWATQGNAAHVRIIGLSLLEDFRRGANGEAMEGRIYNPENGRTYRAALKLRSSDILEVKGLPADRLRYASLAPRRVAVRHRECRACW